MVDLATRSIELELSIGDTIQVGDQFLTVVDIEGEEILFQLDSGEDSDTVSLRDLFSDSH